MRLIYGRLTEGTPWNTKIGDAQVSAAQQGMKFMWESVLFFHRIWVGSSSPVIDFEVYKVEKALLPSTLHNVKSKGNFKKMQKRGWGAGMNGSMAAKLVWRSTNK